MPTLEGKWDCSQCNSTGIPGLTLNCPTCGDPRNVLIDPTERPYLPTDARVITDADELKRAAAGPDWNCGKCGQANIGTAEYCQQCEAPRDGDDTVVGIRTYVSGVDAQGKTLSDEAQLDNDHVDTVLTSADKLQQLETTPVSEPARTLSASFLPRQGAMVVSRAVQGALAVPRAALLLKILAAVIAITLVVGIGWMIYIFNKTSAVELTVQSLSWERQVEVEEFRTLTFDDWSVPSDGRILRKHREIHHYDHVFDHNEDRTRKVSEQVPDGTHQESYPCGSTTVDNGNGTFSEQTKYCERTVQDYKTVYHTEHYNVPIYRDDPVYKTKYVYEIDRWVTDRFVRATGETNPTWPIVTEIDATHREGDERRQSYNVVLIDEEGRSFERSTDEETWSHLSKEEKIEGYQTRGGSLRKVDWPTS